MPPWIQRAPGRLSHRRAKLFGLKRHASCRPAEAPMASLQNQASRLWRIGQEVLSKPSTSYGWPVWVLNHWRDWLPLNVGTSRMSHLAGSSTMRLKRTPPSRNDEDAHRCSCACSNKQLSNMASTCEYGPAVHQQTK